MQSDRIERASQAQVDALFVDRVDALFPDQLDTLFVDRVDTLFANRFDTGSVDRSGTNDTRPPFARVRGHSECAAERRTPGFVPRTDELGESRRRPQKSGVQELHQRP